MVNITKRQPGYSVLNKLYEVQLPAKQNTSLGQFFGADPLLADSKSWYTGLIGEQIVGEILAKLVSEGYQVLHSVPIGSKDSDIDHVLISPTGLIYTINTKHHAGKKIWVGGTVLINGTKVPYVRNSLYESERVGKLFTKAGFNVDVKPLLVFVNPQSMDVKPNAKVDSVTANGLASYLRKQENKRSVENYIGFPSEDLYTDSAFWSTNDSDFTHLQGERQMWFKKLRGNVNSQQAKRTLWKLLFLAAFIGGGIAVALNIAN